jgi:Peptidase family M23
MRALSLAAIALAAATAAAAQEMKPPRVSHTEVDWNAVIADLGADEAPGRRDVQASDLLARLNRATEERFANIAASPVPVLLPFDTAAFLRERAAEAASGAAGQTPGPGGDYFGGFQAMPFFYAGPAGYDAVVMARAQDMRELGIGFVEPIYAHISGSALLYDLDEPARLLEWPVSGLGDWPGIRRVFLENYVRYTFVRYGVPYVVSILCFDGRARFRMPSCYDANKVAIRLLKALRVAGGTPSQPPRPSEPDTIERPAAQSTVFTYRSPSDILTGRSARRGGVADYTVYSRIRFPLADPPAFANSQWFKNRGNCEGSFRYGVGVDAGVYRCRVNGGTQVWDEAASPNYSYPWQDNFCEPRAFFVGQCPGGLGHQGQDIRPPPCMRTPWASHCGRLRDDVVAVRDGAVLRAPGQEALTIVVNAPNERVRFRYLHMQPRRLDGEGLFSGRVVREGEVIGEVGNFSRRRRTTTHHLHFDMQVPTRYGWVFVNPYMTLVAAYERLIGGRGREIRPGIADALAAPRASSPLETRTWPATTTGTYVDLPSQTKSGDGSHR